MAGVHAGARHGVSGCLALEELLSRTSRIELTSIGAQPRDVYPSNGLAGESALELAALVRDLVRKPSAVINAGWGTAWAWARTLGAATLQPRLEETTLISWAGRLPSRELLRDHRAFCAACLWDWARPERASGQAWRPLVPYEPLRWQFRALEVCVVHAVRLRETCPTPGCGRVRAVFAGRASVERCVGCRLLLERPAEELRELEGVLDPDLLEWSRFVDPELGQILARPLEDGEMGPYRFPDILAIAIESVTGGAQREFADRIGMTEAVVFYWKDDRRRPSLPALLRVCRAAGFSLRDVLLGNLEALEASPAPLDRPYVAPSVEHHHAWPYVAPSVEHHHALDKDQMERILSEAIVAEPPPTLASIYADTRVNQRHVRRRYPDRCAAIRRRREAYDADRLVRRRAENERLVLEAIRSLDALNIYPAKNKVHKILPPNLRLIEDVLARIWRAELIRLGWRDPSTLRRLRGIPTPTPMRSDRASRVFMSGSSPVRLSSKAQR